MKDWVVLIACGLIGWGVVSWLMSVIRPPQPRPNAQASPARNQNRPATDIETAWPTILQVDKNATVDEIEKAYHALIAECDRIRFSTWYSAQERQEAEARRTTVCAAYEFIRPRR